LLISVLFERCPKYIECDGYQLGVLGLDVHEIGYADPNHLALTPRFWRFAEKPGLGHIIGALLSHRCKLLPRRDVRHASAEDRPGVNIFLPGCVAIETMSERSEKKI